MNESIFYILKNENEYRGEREQIFRFIEKGKKYDILFYFFIFVVEVMELGKGMKTLKQRAH